MTAFSKNQTAETHIVLTMIPHVTKLFTITSIISALLSKFSVELECSKVLDFIMSSTRNPRVLKGRDSRPARFDPGDRLLSLSVDQLLVLTQYTIAEFCSKLSLANACTFKSNPQPAIEWSIGVAESDDQYEKIYEQSAYFDTRMSMLLHYCETDEHLFRLISWLEDSTENLTEKDIRQIMLLEIYFKCPRVLCNFRAFDVSSKINCLINCRSNKLDLILHSMICRWAHLAKLPGKESSVSQIGSVLKRAARDHPCLMIRLDERFISDQSDAVNFLPSRFARDNSSKTNCHDRVNDQYKELTFDFEIDDLVVGDSIYLCLLPISVEQRIFEPPKNLAPHSFKPYYVSSTMDILNSFIAFARNYVVRFPRLIAFVDKVFVILKAFYAVNPELTISFMKSNASVLQVISNRYPELHSMRSLLSLMSLCTFPMAGRRTCSPLPDGGNDSSDDQWTPLLVRPPSPIYPGQVTQILNRLARASQNPEIIAALKEIEDLCQMKPDGLPYFKDKLVSLLTNENADIRKTALCLIINCLNENPSEIDTVVPMLQHCLNHPELSVAQTIADRLPDICRLCSAKNASLLIRSACLRVNTLQNIEQNLISSISAVNTHCLTGFLSN
ncbi:HEAT repeat protein [Trichuris suis]|nr:HEAT repeat protein [Trichuris suis]